MEPPIFDHIVISVADLERSRQFYSEVMGFHVRAFPLDLGNDLYAGSLVFKIGNIDFHIVKHPQTSAEDRFDERRIGLDHFAFKATSVEHLEEIAQQLKAAGVPTNGVETFQPGNVKYVSFRDPDNIQLEFWLNPRG